MTLSEVRILLAECDNYVLFRLPNEKTGFVVFSDKVTSYDSFPSSFSAMRNSFIMSPFSSELHKTLSISSERIIPFDLEDIHLNMADDESTLLSEPDSSYREAFRQFVSVIREGRFEKLVLSRSSRFTISPQNKLFLFCKACSAYPEAMVYLFHSSLSGDWLGASPELLLTGDDSQLRTVALAGTMKSVGGQTAKFSDWGEKERLEQRIVADYIRERIASFGTLKDEWGPYSVSAGHISHLRTDFYFFMDEDRRADFVSSIHPTPAVCGLPKLEAQRFIMEHEGYDREYYSGFLGWTDANGRTHLYVNLRCMKFSENEATLFAGGGILASSDLLSEWMETEAKMSTMKRLLV